MMSDRLRDTCILGIDPGTTVLGYGLIEVDGTSLRVLNAGAIRLTGLALHQDRLREIFLQIQEIIESYLPSVLAIEAPFYGKNVQSMLKLGRAQGVAIAAGITMGLEIVEYSPKKVKQAVTGNGNAAKEQVAAMLVQLLGPQVARETLDVSDAIAVAYCHYHHISGGFTLPSKGGASNWKQFMRENPGRVKE